MLQWCCDTGWAAGVRESCQLVDAIRHGCQRGQYWLRAYAALPDRFALLLYPLEEPGELIAELEAIVGLRLEKIRPMRDDADLERAAKYVEAMPVRSRLAQRAEDYPWSSLGWIGEVSRGQRPAPKPQR